MFSKPTLKQSILDKAEQNAQSGLIQAKLELRHHSMLLEQLEAKSETVTDATGETDHQREVRLTKEAIERDKKTINNWETQLRAINHERQET